jgi:hypothetical protein
MIEFARLIARFSLRVGVSIALRFGQTALESFLSAIRK